MSVIRRGIPALLAVAVGACGGLSVTSDWDPDFDFAAPSTFAVLDHAGGGELSGLMDERVKNSIRTAMAAKGFREVSDTSQADIAVGYQFASEERSSYSTVNTGWNSYGYGGYGGWYGPYGGGMGVGMSTSTTTERRYDVGSLLIAVFDAQAREMVFTSTGSRTLDDGGGSPQEMQRRIDDAVTEILRDFPPGR